MLEKISGVFSLVPGSKLPAWENRTVKSHMHRDVDYIIVYTCENMETECSLI